ncbi:MAG: hypothetical protein Q7R72_02105 [bacterium]|nr:hypothetical protein [bacterium]
MNIKKIFSLILASALLPMLLLAFASPVFVHAQSAGAECGSVGGNLPAGTSGGNPTVSSGGNPSSPTSGGLSNPIGGVPSIACLFYKIVDFIMSLSYVVIAFFLLLSGFKFVTAQGSQDKLTEAKKTFWYTVVGALILIGANTIIQVVQGIIKGIQS